MIHLITRETIGYFQHIVPGLQRALDKTDLSRFWDMESLWNYLINYQAYAFFQQESGYAGVFTINRTPKCSTVYFFWSGKDPDVETPVDYPEVDEFLEAIAQHFGCTSITCEGRKGWKSILSPLGYSEDSVVYIKEVAYEPVPVSRDDPSGCDSSGCDGRPSVLEGRVEQDD